MLASLPWAREWRWDCCMVASADLALSPRSWFYVKGFGDMLLSPIYCILCFRKSIWLPFKPACSCFTFYGSEENFTNSFKVSPI